MRDINRDIGDMYARKADHEADFGRIMREEARERAKDAELDALRQRVAELEAALRRINTTAIMVQNRAAQVMGEPDTLRRAMSEITSLAIKIKANATEYID